MRGMYVTLLGKKKTNIELIIYVHGFEFDMCKNSLITGRMCMVLK